MIVGIPKETFPGERRVAIVPSVIPSLTKAGLHILTEASAGDEAGFPDAAFLNKGAQLASNRSQVFADADMDQAIEGTMRSVFANCGQVCLGGG